jgi:hypothetical protein
MILYIMMGINFLIVIKDLVGWFDIFLVIILTIQIVN